MKRIDFSFIRLRYYNAQKITEETASIGKIGKKFPVKKYGIFDEKDVQNKINTFSCLGFKDPFPNESKFVSEWYPPISSYDYVYDVSKMKNDEQPPSLIFLPRKELMFKLIRACLGVENDN
jgi:hypothetical protein